MKSFLPFDKSQQGNILFFLIVTLVVLGSIGGVLVSIYSTSSTALSTPDHSRQATYLAESGIRYALSEYRKGTSLSSLANTYTMSTNNQFELQFMSLWFESPLAQSIASGNLVLNVADGLPLKSTIVPTGVFLVAENNLAGPFVSAAGNDKFSRILSVTPNTSSASPTDVTISLLDDFQTDSGSECYFSVKPAGSQTLNSGDSLTIATVSSPEIIPSKRGCFYYNGEYFYYSSSSSSIFNTTLDNITSSTGESFTGKTFSQLSLIVFKKNNSDPLFKPYIIEATGQSGSSTQQAEEQSFHTFADRTSHATLITGTGTPTDEQLFGDPGSDYKGIIVGGTKLTGVDDASTAQDEDVRADLNNDNIQDTPQAFAIFGDRNATVVKELIVSFGTNATDFNWQKGVTYPFSLNYSNSTDILTWEVGGESTNATFSRDIAVTQRLVGNFFIQSNKPTIPGTGAMEIKDIVYRFGTETPVILSAPFEITHALSGDTGNKFILTQRAAPAESLEVNGTITMDWGFTEPPPAFGFKIEFFLFDL